MKTVIFDLDGTLADTSGDLIAAANTCFQMGGHGDLLDPETDKLTAFGGAKAMLRLGYSRVEGFIAEAQVEQDYPKFLAEYGENIHEKTVIYPGCLDAVEALRSGGFAVGICTNKPEALAETLLQRLGIRDMFGSVVGADTLAVSKPYPEPYVESVKRAGGVPEKSLLVGDTETDVKTARAAGVPVVLVAFGPEGERVARHTPDALLPEYEMLGRLVEVLL